MRNFQNVEDRDALDAAEEQNFIDDCSDEFIEKSLAMSNLRKVRVLGFLSYLPNILSGITAGFFVLYLLSGYRSGPVMILLGMLLLLIVITVELGKRYLITGVSHTYFVRRRVAGMSVMALVVLFGISMTASYLGGNALVVETATPPPRPRNAQIDSLNLLLAAELGTIGRLERTTWKGKVTSDAVKGINKSKDVQAGLLGQISKLEAADSEAYEEELQKHESKHLNFGIVLGVLAALADVFLLGLLWMSKKLKYEVAAVKAKGKQRQREATQQEEARAMEAAMEAAKAAEEKAERLAAEVAQLKTQQGAYHGVPPNMYNQKRAGNTIGFTVGRDNDKSLDEDDVTINRNDKSLHAGTDNDKSLRGRADNDKSLGEEAITINRNDKSLQPEVVTIVETNTIELTDRVRTCGKCNTRFVYYNSKAKYCSTECRLAAWQSRTGRKINKGGGVS